MKILVLAVLLAMTGGGFEPGGFAPPATFVAPQGAEAIIPLEGLDPVLLAEGKEVQGEDKFSLVRGRFRYFFASAETRARFEKEPGRHEIQLGGTCARMGPGVRGNPDLFLVHEGRIYIFGSPACVKAFKDAPGKFLETEKAAAPAAAPSAESLRRGRALVERSVEAAGGAARIDALKSYSESGVVEVRRPNGVEEMKTSLLRVFPDKFRQERTYSFGTIATVVTPGDAFASMPRNLSPLVDEQRADFERQQKRSLLSILRARSSQGFTAAAVGGGKVGETNVEHVDVWFDGLSVRLGVDPSTGRVLSLSYRGRSPGGAFGEIVQTFSDFRAVEGLTLPFKAAGTFDGEPEPSLSFRAESVVVNGEADPSLFERPKAAAAAQQ